MNKLILSIIIFLSSISPVKNQGNTNACVFYATTTAIEYSYYQLVRETLELNPAKIYDEYRRGGSDTGVDSTWLLDNTGLASVFAPYADIKVSKYKDKEEVQNIIEEKYTMAVVFTKTHALCAIAYTPSRIICQNSYGTSIDNEGFTEVKYTDVKYIARVIANPKQQDLIFPIDKKYFYKGNDVIQIDTEAIINKDDRALIPLRAVAEAFNAEVEWDAESRRVVIKR